MSNVRDAVVPIDNHELNELGVLDVKTLQKSYDPRSTQTLRETFGKKEHLLQKLHSDEKTGLTEEKINEHTQRFGVNKLPDPKVHPYFHFLWLASREKMVLFLIIASLVSVGTGVFETVRGETNAWLEGVVIVIAVLVIVLVNSVNDYRKQGQFLKLDKTTRALKKVKVLRNGKNVEIPEVDLVVGDIAYVALGDVLSVDGVLIQGKNIILDESNVTGESDQINKTPYSDEKDKDKDVEDNDEADSLLLAGTTVLDGKGKMLVMNVGTNTLIGKSIPSTSLDPPMTNLQKSLTILSNNLAKFGLAIAALDLAALLILYFFIKTNATVLAKVGLTISSLCLAFLIMFFAARGRPKSLLSKLILAFGVLATVAIIATCIVFSTSLSVIDELTAIIFVGISITVMAIPEGLPLAISLSLAHANINMLNDNCLVRHLAAAEVMGGVTSICSDKTGTLTQNKMQVVKYNILGQEDLSFDKMKNDMDVYQKVIDNLLFNSDLTIIDMPDGSKRTLGNKTDVALREFVENLDISYEELEKTVNVEQTPFNSQRKLMSTKVQHKGSNKIIEYIKGASEIILSNCDKILHQNGTVSSLDEEEKIKLTNIINDYAHQSLRTIGCAYREVDNDNNVGTNDDSSKYIFTSLFGIIDPLRSDAEKAVSDCQQSGVVVRMCTGDNKNTAYAIAKNSGIIPKEGTDEELGNKVVMEGHEFSSLSDEERAEAVKHLRVMARCSPNDKLVLVKTLQDSGEVVAVTGDGANDAPALKQSDIGFAMGIAGTETSKQAADIVILDDSFNSLVKSIAWGRTVYTGVQKFVMFQLPVNFASVLIVVVTSLSTAATTGTPAPGLLALQILYLNLVSDSLASLALSTDKPVESTLKSKPRRKEDKLVTPFMMRMIIVQTAYMSALGLLVFYIGPFFWGYDYVTRTTMVFNVFTLAVLANELNCRTVDRNKNVFTGIWKNKFFLPMWILGLILQYIIVTYVGIIFDTTPIEWWMWIVSIVLGSGSLLLGFLVRTF